MRPNHFLYTLIVVLFFSCSTSKPLETISSHNIKQIVVKHDTIYQKRPNDTIILGGRVDTNYIYRTNTIRQKVFIHIRDGKIDAQIICKADSLQHIVDSITNTTINTTVLKEIQTPQKDRELLKYLLLAVGIGGLLFGYFIFNRKNHE
jgi:hypothetical protein